jgi:hypothetical protein
MPSESSLSALLDIRDAVVEYKRGKSDVVVDTSCADAFA